MNMLISKKIIASIILGVMLITLITSPVFATTPNSSTSGLSLFLNFLTKGTITTLKVGTSLLDILFSKNTSTKEKETKTTIISSKSSFLSVAKERHDYIRNNEFYYSQGTSVPANASEFKGIDCSAYVCDVLYHYGYTEFKGHQKTCSYFMNKSNMQSKGWKVLSATEAKAGDIVVRSGHMEIYAGNGKFYNAGSTKAIRKEYSNSGVSYLNKFTYAIRVTSK